MKLTFDDIIDKHKGQRGFVIGMGPSILPYIDELVSLSRDTSNIFVSCNHCESIIPEIRVDYWVLANNLPGMRVEANPEKWHKRPKSTLIWACSVDTSDIGKVDTIVRNDHLPYNQRINPGREGVVTIQDVLKQYSGNTAAYGGGDTVALHMITVAILLGLKDISIIGVDLDYQEGYARNDRGVSPLQNAHAEMVKYRQRITDHLEIINNSASLVGANLRPFKAGSPYLNEVFAMFNKKQQSGNR